MKTYQVKFEQFVPASLPQVWDFFSSPLNLARITPPDMAFTVTSDYSPDAKVYAGMIITYTVAPIFGIKFAWMTEISNVQEQVYFVDEQRFGPFALWHHQHHFKAVAGGVLMTDILNYAIPYGPIGRLANKLVVEKQVGEIFDFRTKAINEIFGTNN